MLKIEIKWWFYLDIVLYQANQVLKTHFILHKIWVKYIYLLTFKREGFVHKYRITRKLSRKCIILLHLLSNEENMEAVVKTQNEIFILKKWSWSPVYERINGNNYSNVPIFSLPRHN